MMQQFVVLVAAVLASAVCVQSCGDSVLEQNFDKYPGAYKLWDKTMGEVDMPGFKFMKIDTAANSMVGQGSYRVTNPQGCVGTAECAATYDVMLPPMDEATLSYKFMHSAGYVFGLGGKLPGLCSDDCPSGCTTVTDANGFSARVMWREDTANPGQTQMMSYSYYYGMTESNCGEDWLWGKTVQAGVWNTIEMYVKVNTGGLANGAQKITYNGEVVLDRSDILWSKNYHPIEKFTFRAFHGGGSAKWASAQDQYISFDDIKVVSGACGAGGAAATTVAVPTPPGFSAPPASAPKVAPAPPVIQSDDSNDDLAGSDLAVLRSLRPEKDAAFVEEMDVAPKQRTGGERVRRARGQK